MVDDGKRIALHNLNSCSTLFIAECVSGEMRWYGKGKGNGWGVGGGQSIFGTREGSAR